MKKILFAALLSLTSLVKADKVTDFIQDVSVTIVTPHGQGSGVVKMRDGISYIWTAGHVVASQRRTRTVADAATSSVRTLVYFEPVQVVKDIVENGRRVGRLVVDAEVIKFSDAETGEDLAVLKAGKKNFLQSSAEFYLDKEIPFCGTELYHVGSLLGIFGSNSLTHGIYSQQGRIIDNNLYDQSTCTAFPGSSGGGIFLTDGRYVGMLVRGSGETFNFFIPIRRIRAWATINHLDFALDDSVPVDIHTYPVENLNEAPSVTPDGPLVIRRGESYKGIPDGAMIYLR